VGGAGAAGEGKKEKAKQKKKKKQKAAEKKTDKDRRAPHHFFRWFCFWRLGLGFGNRRLLVSNPAPKPSPPPSPPPPSSPPFLFPFFLFPLFSFSPHPSFVSPPPLFTFPLFSRTFHLPLRVASSLSPSLQSVLFILGLKLSYV
jgi:hypothetical protein